MTLNGGWSLHDAPQFWWDTGSDAGPGVEPTPELGTSSPVRQLMVGNQDFDLKKHIKPIWQYFGQNPSLVIISRETKLPGDHGFIRSQRTPTAGFLAIRSYLCRWCSMWAWAFVAIPTNLRCKLATPISSFQHTLGHLWAVWMPTILMYICFSCGIRAYIYL